MEEQENKNVNPKIITYDNVTVDDVIGLEDVKNFFRDTLIYYYKNRDRCNKLGVSQTRGIIIKGAPGVGKTLVCAACVNSYGNNLIDFKIIESAELSSNQKGESEKKIKELFSKIKKDTLIIIDEIDTITASRRKLSSVLAKEVTSALIKALDRNKHIVLIGTTNFPEDIDDAIMRRVDEVIEAPYPNYRDRLKMFKLCLNIFPLDDNVSIEELARETEGFTGNDILTILKRKLGMIYMKKQDKNSNALVSQDEITDILYSIHKPNLSDTKTTESKIYDLLKNNNGDGLYRNDIADKLQIQKQNVSRALTSMRVKEIVVFKKVGTHRLYTLLKD